jgi:hypothetical protein
VYIPIYSTEKGAIDVKVVIKFKDESMKKYIEIKRFSFRVLVKPSFEVNADWKVKMIKKEENEQWNNVYVDYWINLTMHNSNMLADLDIKDIYTGCNVSLVNDDKDKVSQWCSNNVIKGKYYRCLTLSITDNDNNNNNNGMNDDKQDDDIDPDDPHLNEHLIKKDNTSDDVNNNDNVMNVYPELLKCYQEKKNTIIFTWQSNQTPSNTNTQQQQQQISGFFILDLPELLPIHTTPTQLCKPLLTLELTQPFLQTLIENICTITLTLKPFPSNNTTLIILTLNINCEALFPFNNIISFKTFILPNNTNLPLTWLGTTKYTHFLSNHLPNYTVNFICQTALKGTIPLNNIGILFTFSTSTSTHLALSTTTFKPKYIETHI